MPSREPKGIYTRYLPHWDKPGLYQGITFRLRDSVPKSVIESWRNADTKHLNDVQRARMEKLINAGHGNCWMRDPEIAKIVEDALLFFQGERYEIIAWVVMPNHVHTLLKTHKNYSLPDVIGSWKGYTSRVINQKVGRKGKLWAEGFYDRYMRDWKHFLTAVNYIHQNPVKAGLVKNARDWPFSSVKRFDDDIRITTESGLFTLKR